MCFHRGRCVGMLALVLSCVTVSDALAQDIRQVGKRTDLSWSPRRPDSARVDGCYGNCGAGCSSKFNPGCGGSQYWEKRIIGPLTSKRYTITECRVNGDDHASDEGVRFVQGEEYVGTITRYTSRGLWVYRGFTARLCQEHDYFCRTRGGCGNASLEDHLRPLFRRIGGCTGVRREEWWYGQTFTAWDNLRRMTRSGRTCTTTAS